MGLFVGVMLIGWGLYALFLTQYRRHILSPQMPIFPYKLLAFTMILGGLLTVFSLLL
jgi:hypothetical protein